MNVLPIVFSLLLLLSLVTVARLQSYGISKLLFKQKVQTLYAELDERNSFEKNRFMELINQQNKENLRTDEKKQGGEKKKEAPFEQSVRVDATRKVNLYPIFNRSFAALNPGRELQYRTLFKNLIEVMFQEERFYQEAIENNPNIVDQLIDAFLISLEQKNEPAKIENVKKLRNLALSNKELEQFRYFIFAGKESLENKGVPENGNTTSLLDLIEYTPNIRPIRVYLARREVLLAIYKDPECVDEILKKREALYRQVKKNPAIKEEVSGDFERSFSSRRPGWIDPMLLNYKVTTTDPKEKVG